MSIMQTKLFICLSLLFLSFNNYAQSWVNQTSPTTNSLREVRFINANEGWAVGDAGTFLKTTNGGTTWYSIVFVKPTLLIGCHFFNSLTGFVAGDDGAYKTTDGGTSWTYITGSNLITKMCFFNSSLGFAVGGSTSGQYGAIYKTTDGGTTWSSTINNSSWHRMYGVQFVNATTGFVFDENGLMLKTTNTGASWIPVNYGAAMTITAMKFSDENNGMISGRLSASPFLLKTTDAGATWSNAVNNFQYIFSDICFIGNNVVWAAGGTQTESFIFNSTDGGSTWTNTSTGAKPWSSIFFADANNGWAVSQNGDIMKYNGTTGVNDNNPKTPTGFSLHQNFPNPFNPNTTIKFTIREKFLVNLSVFNTLGIKVAELVNGNKNAGEYQVNFNAANLPSGVYIYKLNAGNSSSSNKMIILK
jgi:photosystem II stability/assembly factor-like uncharacterized protein